MAASASRRPTPSGSARLSIGQVLDVLQEEFPDLSHSKLHYLEAEELISPERTASGYRKYSRADVDRLLFVLRAQRDRFWPLKVIKEHLLEHGVDDDVTSIASRPGPTSQIQPVRLDRRGLLREAQVDEELLEELESYGMLEEGLVFYGASELEIVRAARVLADEGLHPRHLVMVRTSVERQAHMLRSVAQPHSRPTDAAARGQAQSLAEELGESLNSLHNALLRKQIHRGG
ncbi:MerR family transcriptional regulator [Brachybacterium kimchii]|uniref:MerR family transcriptional regulator n=1 Tax=Brachybacterium kimchii TaxID=2942909 RepID=A0ABY4N8C8_9MICO|nr:MerR family transcriptional regulator [Brachybacterium kimchii]UQN30813.1 MerR family transcriptional regulator [Brachybacterium kimchii]